MNANLAMPTARATRATPRAPTGLGRSASVPIAGEYPNFYASYTRERDYSRRLERTLSDALSLLTMECGRRKLHGEDAEAIESFVAEARKVSL